MQTNQFRDPRVLVAVIFSLALIIAVWMWHDIEKQKFNAGENRFQIHSTTERQLPVVLILDIRTGEVWRYYRNFSQDGRTVIAEGFQKIK